METNKKYKFYVRIEYTIMDEKWIDEIVVNTDKTEKIYSYVKKTYTNPTDIQISMLSEMNHVSL